MPTVWRTTVPPPAGFGKGLARTTVKVNCMIVYVASLCATISSRLKPSSERVNGSIHWVHDLQFLVTGKVASVGMEIGFDESGTPAGDGMSLPDVRCFISSQGNLQDSILDLLMHYYIWYLGDT